MTKYCLSCGAPNSGAATVCSRCGKVIGNKGVTPPPIYDLHGFQNFKGSVTQKYQVWSIIMFVIAGIYALLLIMVANEFSKNEWSLYFMSYKQRQSAYNGMYGMIIFGIFMIFIFIHCGILLRRTRIRSKGVFIFYGIVLGLFAIIDIITLFLGIIAGSDGAVLLGVVINLAFNVTPVVMLYLKVSEKMV